VSAEVASLPFGIFSVGADLPRAGVKLGERVLDLSGLLEDPVFDHDTLNPFLALGPAAWASTRAALADLVTATDGGTKERVDRHAISLADVRMHLPIAVADFVDFYSSLEHASNAGKILRPRDEPLMPNWRHLPVGYHGRAGTVVNSGTAVRRPRGQQLTADGAVVHEPSSKLDIEVELGFVVGAGSVHGSTVDIDDFTEHVFGTVLLIDWSARDIQAWEYRPLGPFLSKSFATSISPWVVPLGDLASARIAPAVQDPAPLPHLTSSAPFTYDIRLELRLNGHLVSAPEFASMYWTPAQQLAHMTSNGASLRTGDLYGTGTISSWDVSGFGSFMELTWNGRDPIVLPTGEQRGFLADGDEVSITASAPGPDGVRIDLGEVTGRVLPTEPYPDPPASSTTPTPTQEG
jgi:fumarylacetoacetase